MFSATVKLVQRLTSWYTVLIPRDCACWVDFGCISWPSRRILPESGRSTPVNIFIKVDFPAPFSPTKQRISPLLSVKLTFSRACTPGKSLLMPSITRIYSSDSDIPPTFIDVSLILYVSRRYACLCNEILLRLGSDIFYR